MPSLLLIHALPKAGFTYPYGGSQVTSRRQYDKQIQKAIRAYSTRFDRVEVTPLLIRALGVATVTLQAVYVPESLNTSAITAVYEALEVTQRATAWAAGLEPSVFAQLMLGVRAARRIALKKAGRDETPEGSWARSLAVAVDEFDEALQQRGWGTAEMLHALEGDLGGAGDEDEGDEDDDDEEMEYTGGIDPAEEARLCEGLTKVNVEQGEVMEGVEMEVDGEENTAEKAEKKEEETEAEAEHYLLGDDKF